MGDAFIPERSARSTAFVEPLHDFLDKVVDPITDHHDFNPGGRFLGPCDRFDGANVVGEKNEVNEVDGGMNRELDRGALKEIQPSLFWSGTALFARVDTDLVEVAADFTLELHEASSVRLLLRFGPQVEE